MDPRTEKMLAERAQRAAATPPAPPRSPLGSTDNARLWAKTHGGTIKLLAAALVAVLIAIRYLAVTLPEQRADRREMEARAAESVKADAASTHVSISDCLSKAQADADARWTAACKARRQGPNCPLPEEQATAFEHDESAARNACLIGH